MYLAADYIHPTPHGGRCRIRIYHPDEARDAVVVICTELANNPGMSVTNAVRRVATEVIETHRLPTPLVWIEHHPPATTDGHMEVFELVLFDSYEIRAGRGRIFVTVIPTLNVLHGSTWVAWLHLAPGP